MKKLIAIAFVLSISFGPLTACTFDSTTSYAGDTSRSAGGGWGAARGAASGGLDGTQDLVDDTVDSTVSGYNASASAMPGDPVGPIQTSGPDHH